MENVSASMAAAWLRIGSGGGSRDKSDGHGCDSAGAATASASDDTSTSLTDTDFARQWAVLVPSSLFFFLLLSSSFFFFLLLSSSGLAAWWYAWAGTHGRERRVPGGRAGGIAQGTAIVRHHSSHSEFVALHGLFSHFFPLMLGKAGFVSYVW